MIFALASWKKGGRGNGNRRDIAGVTEKWQERWSEQEKHSLKYRKRIGWDFGLLRFPLIPAQNSCQWAWQAPTRKRSYWATDFFWLSLGIYSLSHFKWPSWPLQNPTSKKAVLTKTPTKTILSHLLSTTPVSLLCMPQWDQEWEGRITGKYAALHPGLCLPSWTVALERGQKNEAKALALQVPRAEPNSP